MPVTSRDESVSLEGRVPAEWPFVNAPAGWPHAHPTGGVWPRVTLVTPSLNQARFLEGTLLSVLHQGYPDLEYMVFDGGSSDGTLDLLQPYAVRLAAVVSESDRGQADAINHGWQRATGAYVWWLNADDQLTPQSLALSVGFLEANPDVDMVYGDVIRIDEDDRRLDLFRYPPFDLNVIVARGLALPQAGAFMRSSLIKRLGYLDADLHYSMDAEYWDRAILAGCRIDYLPQPLALFRIHDESKTQSGSARAVEERYIVHQRFFQDPRLPIEVRRMQPRARGLMHLGTTRLYLKIGRYRAALGELGLALRAWPAICLRPTFAWHALVTVFGLFVGASTWLKARSLLRRLRRRRAE
jgi:glycosyltransferase involved in cell wall biosynthesis